MTKGQEITVYVIRSGFANVIDSVSLRQPRGDRIYEERRVRIPPGYTIAECMCGTDEIYDERGQHCDLCLNNMAGRVVLAVSANRVVALTRVRDEHVSSPSLRDVRMRAELTQQQLADAAGVNIRLIQKLEGGEVEPGNVTARNLLAIADVLGVEPRVLL